jgi:hypothetical protein
MVNRTYADMARHYGTAIVPARPYKPRDKAKVEVGVQVVGRWILARLRHRRFFSLGGLNAAIRALHDELNNRPMRGWGASRRALFEQLDQSALGSLPPLPYEYAESLRLISPKIKRGIDVRKSESRSCHVTVFLTSMQNIMVFTKITKCHYMLDC